jgi:hypothetical protein
LYDDLFLLEIILIIIIFNNIEFSLIKSSYAIFGLRREIILFINFVDIFIIPTTFLDNLILNIVLRIRAVIDLFSLFSANILMMMVLVGAIIL